MARRILLPLAAMAALSGCVAAGPGYYGPGPRVWHGPSYGYVAPPPPRAWGPPAYAWRAPPPRHWGGGPRHHGRGHGHGWRR
ncbi:hypothetical protein ACI6QG_03170 [Roseococcus sp. DSY-14]|uniref:hypothetical protein n=1 Tax=Roseococcus sp. DSY-14 TaxID=3369650 RepID=UPI00387B8EAA